MISENGVYRPDKYNPNQTLTVTVKDGGNEYKIPFNNEALRKLFAKWQFSIPEFVVEEGTGLLIAMQDDISPREWEIVKAALQAYLDAGRLDLSYKDVDWVEGDRTDIGNPDQVKDDE